ncbi:MAG: right-handed parallel beta-helix repeat-containing protein [Azospirillaceae bacterium]
MVDLYLPLAGDQDSVVMGTLRGLSSTDDREFLSAGLIARWLDARENPEESWIYGASLFADVPHTAEGNTFVGLGAGVEAMSADWDLRLNGYLPIEASGRNDDYAAVSLEGERIFLRGGEEHWLAGMDAEVGWRLPFDEPGGATEVWLRGGGYWFDHPDTADRHGFTASVELVWRDVPWEAIPFTEFRVEGGIREDGVTGTEGYLGLRGRIDLGLFANDWPGQRDPVARRMEDPWRRLDGPILDGAPSGPEEPAIDPATGRVLAEVIFLDPGNPNLPGGPIGPSIRTAAPAVMDDGDGRLIVVSGAIPGTLSLREGDTIVGGGAALPLVGANSGMAASFSPDFPGGTIVTSGTTGLELASDSHVIGLTFQGDGTDRGNGIHGGDGLTNVTIDRIGMTGFQGTGIEIGAELAGFSLTGSRIASGGTGLVLGAGARDVLIADNTLDGLVQNGVIVHDTDGVTITANTFADTGKSAIDATGSTNDHWQISGNVFRRIGANAIGIENASHLQITDNRLQTIGADAVRLHGSLERVTLVGNHLSGVEGSGIHLGGGFMDRIVIASNVLEHLGSRSTLGSGIIVEGSFTTRLSLTGNLIDEGNGVLGTGILVGPGSDFTVDGNTVLGVNDVGIRMTSSSSSSSVSNNVIQGDGVGIAFGNASGLSANQGFEIAGNTIHGGRVGLAFAGEQTGHSITDNVLSGMEMGIFFEGVANSNALIGNSFADISGTGVVFQRPVISVEVSRNSFTGGFGDSLFLLSGTSIAGGFSGSGNIREGQSLTGNVCIETVSAQSGSGFSFVDGAVCGLAE